MKGLQLSEYTLMSVIVVASISLVVTLLFLWISKLARNSGSFAEERDVTFRKWGMFSRDLRSVRRVACNISLQVFDREGIMPSGSGRLVNFSNQGACVVTTTPFLIGDSFIARMQSEKHKNARVAGRIVWFKPEGDLYTYGIQYS